MDTKEAGKKGGSETLRRFGKDYFKELSKKAVEAKRLKKTIKEVR